MESEARRDERLAVIRNFWTLYLEWMRQGKSSLCSPEYLAARRILEAHEELVLHRTVNLDNGGEILVVDREGSEDTAEMVDILRKFRGKEWD